MALAVITVSAVSGGRGEEDVAAMDHATYAVVQALNHLLPLIYDKFDVHFNIVNQ